MTLPTPITEFPLFYRRAGPVAVYAAAVTMFNAPRNDQVLCVSAECHFDNDASYSVLSANDSIAVSEALHPLCAW